MAPKRFSQYLGGWYGKTKAARKGEDNPSTESTSTSNKKAKSGSASASGTPAQTRAISCDHCRRAKLKCEKVFPCMRCVKLGLSCEDPQANLEEEERAKLLSVRHGWKLTTTETPPSGGGRRAAADQTEVERCRSKKISREKALRVLRTFAQVCQSYSFSSMIPMLNSWANGLQLNLSSITSDQPASIMQGENLPFYMKGHFDQGRPEDLLHPFLLPIFSEAFISFGSVYRHGLARVFANRNFALMFYKEPEIMVKIQEHQMLPDEICASIIHPNDRQFFAACLDHCLFGSDEAVKEVVHVIQCIKPDDPQCNTSFQCLMNLRVVVHEGYVASMLALQVLPMRIELNQGLGLLTRSAFRSAQMIQDQILGQPEAVVKGGGGNGGGGKKAAGKGAGKAGSLALIKEHVFGALGAAAKSEYTSFSDSGYKSEPHMYHNNHRFPPPPPPPPAVFGAMDINRSGGGLPATVLEAKEEPPIEMRSSTCMVTDDGEGGRESGVTVVDGYTAPPTTDYLADIDFDWDAWEETTLSPLLPSLLPDLEQGTVIDENRMSLGDDEQSTVVTTVQQQVEKSSTVHRRLEAVKEETKSGLSADAVLAAALVSGCWSEDDANRDSLTTCATEDADWGRLSNETYVGGGGGGNNQWSTSSPHPNVYLAQQQQQHQFSENQSMMMQQYVVQQQPQQQQQPNFMMQHYHNQVQQQQQQHHQAQPMMTQQHQPQQQQPAPTPPATTGRWPWFGHQHSRHNNGR